MPELTDKLKPYSAEVSRLAKKLNQHASIGLFNHLKGISVINGNLANASPQLRTFIEENAALCQPDHIHVCDGTDSENTHLLGLMQSQGTLKYLSKYDNCWLASTNPADTARVESRTFICTERRSDVVPETASGDGAGSSLGNWIAPGDMDVAVQERFTNCMKGRTMYVVPFSMGPLGSPLSKIGIQLTDSPYVVASMRIMTRMGHSVLEQMINSEDHIGGDEEEEEESTPFVRCLHSVGTPRSGFIEMPSWPCDPERTIILHKPATKEIVSYGSGYGGNSLLGKKCFALRIGSTIARREGWLAEHMLILGVTNPHGVKRYIAAAFPSACGKTNLAMMTPTLPGYKIECVGDDIAWMRLDAAGQLRAINPENGFFGVAPGTSTASNPVAMATIFRNSIFTNVASTSDGGVFWEGMEDELGQTVRVTDWRGRVWSKEKDGPPAAHPNSRFCTPAAQCPIIDDQWEAAEGVPISAILFGGRRPTGVPLVYEARDWNSGVLIGASMRSEATAAAEYKGKMIMHDPFAMRPFFGYNFGHYLAHWLSMKQRSNNLPSIFHVNWFRKGADGKFLWPGFGENCRVLDWILKRLDNEDCAQDSPIGYIPKPGSINIDGLSANIDMEQLFHLPKEFWQEEVFSIEKYFKEQVGKDLPEEIRTELSLLKQRVNKM